MAYIYDLADTWNDGATTFNGIRLNVTDTASVAESLLMSLQVGGANRFSVRKDGRVTASGDVLFSTYVGDSGGARVRVNSISTPYVTVASGGFFGLSAGNVQVPDIILTRDAANTLAQRNGVNAQAFNLYNTYTDASNYERGFMRFVSNVMEIGTEAAGTGTVRALQITGGPTAPSGFRMQNGVTINYRSLAFSPNAPGAATFNAGFYAGAANILELFGSSAALGGAFQLLEMTAPAAPASDRVRIYAEDNGSGKTRLMALFATGAAVQIAIEP